MSLALRTAALMLGCIALSFGAVACNRGDTKASSGSPAKAQTASVPKFQVNRAPCDWITRADAEKALGEPLVADPVRVRSADNTVPQADGDGCLYELKGTSELSKREVSIALDIDDAGGIQAGFSGVRDVQAVFKDKLSHGDSLVGGRWDYVSGVPGGLTMARVGRIVTQVSAYGEMEKGMALASAIMDRVEDEPFADNPTDPAAAPSGSDPCALISRQEAEAVLGPLTMAPYRSRESTALAYGNGPSCSYFTGKHRVLVVTPTYDGGAMQYKMMAGVSGMVSGVLGGGNAPDTSKGPWDKMATGATGALDFLKGDTMVELQYKASPTDYNGAVKLARVAAARL